LLHRAICSVLDQSYPHVQVCVYDNASGDKTETVVTQIAQTDNRVRYFRHAENIGYIQNILYGLRTVATPYFSILSDDDVLTTWFYESAMAGFAQHPDAMFSALDSVKISETNAILAGPIWGEADHRQYFAPGEAFEGVTKGQIPVPWVGTLFRRELLDDIGVPNPDAGPHLNDDFILHAAARYACVVSSAIGCLISESHSSVGAGMRALNADWHRWWETVRKDVLSDALVSERVRQQAQQRLILDFRRIAMRQVIQGLGRFGHRGPEYARQAADGVGECGYPVTSALLQLSVWLHTNFPPVRTAFDRFVAHRRKRTFAQRALLTHRYSHLTEYLTSLEARGRNSSAFLRHPA
jgi:hypothetical protein